MHKKSIKKNGYSGFSELLDSCDPYSWINSSRIFCTWSRSDEGDLFWWGVCLLWQCECIFKEFHDIKSEKLPSQIRNLLVSICDYDRCFDDYGCKESLIDKAKEFKSKILSKSENLRNILNKRL